jgi:hypothetical protein
MRYDAGGRRQDVTVPVDDAERYAIGRNYPIVVRRDDPSAGRLLAEPYDAAEPIWWSVRPAAAPRTLRRTSGGATAASASPEPRCRWIEVDTFPAGAPPRRRRPAGAGWWACTVTLPFAVAGWMPWTPWPARVLAAGRLEPGELLVLRSPAGGPAVAALGEAG